LGEKKGQNFKNGGLGDVGKNGRGGDLKGGEQGSSQ